MGELIIAFLIVCGSYNGQSYDVSNISALDDHECYEYWMNDPVFQQFMMDGNYDALPDYYKEKLIQHINNNKDVYASVVAFLRIGEGDPNSSEIIFIDDTAE